MQKMTLQTSRKPNGPSSSHVVLVLGFADICRFGEVMEIVDVSSWDELKEFARGLTEGIRISEIIGSSMASPILFRGQADFRWTLTTTLERYPVEVSKLWEYYRVALMTKAEVETFTGSVWNQPLSVDEVREICRNYDLMGIRPLPGIEYLAYLRHHGFPSPLLDWSESIYVAALMAFNEPPPQSSTHIAIYAYCHDVGEGTMSGSDEPQILPIGHNIKSSKRHFLQKVSLHLVDAVPGQQRVVFCPSRRVDCFKQKPTR